MGKGISYRGPVGYSLATAAVALWGNEQAKAVLADYGYTEVSDAALDTIRRNKAAKLEQIRQECDRADGERRAEIVRIFLRERGLQINEPETDPR